MRGGPVLHDVFTTIRTWMAVADAGHEATFASEMASWLKEEGPRTPRRWMMSSEILQSDVICP